MDMFRKQSLLVAAASVLVFAYGVAIGHAAFWQAGAVMAAVALAVGLGAVPPLRGYQFTAWIVAAVVVGMAYPWLFAALVPGTREKPGNLWIVPLIVQVVMFGMGTQMSLRDFAGVMKLPWAVFVGVVCHFTIMPLVGFTLTKVFPLPDEIAAGIILIGSCSAGLASNVMVYMARANLALSITMTAITTMISPIMTPFWMKMLAGEMVEGLEFSKMALDIMQLVILPIGAALLHDFLKHASAGWRRFVFATAIGSGLWLATRLADWLGWIPATPAEFALAITIFNLVCGAIVAGVVYHWLVMQLPALEQLMPRLSMFGIISYTAISTAAGRDQLLMVGGLLFAAAAIHNALGYVLGYWLSRALGLDRQSARTVAFEVGLQNGGMATGLASKMGRLATVGLAAIVFSPWMNVSGSILANYWRKRPVEESSPQMD